MATASFRFYEELNDFLAPERRRREFSAPCARAATTKHMIEALGVPHTEVELILVNGESVGFERLLQDGDRVAVYPRFEALDITPLLRVRERPLRVTRFVADAHLGGLAHMLRMAGFDTLRFDGAVGSAPVGRINNGTLTDPTDDFPEVNTIHGVTPGGAPWTIASFRADIRPDGRVRPAAKACFCPAETTSARGVVRAKCWCRCSAARTRFRPQRPVP